MLNSTKLNTLTHEMNPHVDVTCSSLIGWMMFHDNSTLIVNLNVNVIMSHDNSTLIVIMSHDNSTLIVNLNVKCRWVGGPRSPSVRGACASSWPPWLLQILQHAHFPWSLSSRVLCCSILPYRTRPWVSCDP
jgi:hypothetical protein